MNGAALRDVVRDLLQSQGADGAWHWDAKKPMWPGMLWAASIATALALGVHQALAVPHVFNLLDFGGGVGALLTGGGGGTWLHMRAHGS